MGYRAARDRDPAVRRDLRDGRRRAGILIRVPAGRSSAVLAGGSDGLVPRTSTARIDTRFRVVPGRCRTGTSRAPNPARRTRLTRTRATSVSYERYRWRQMGATTESSSLPYQVVTNKTGRVFRVGESPRDILGHGRWVPIMAAWLAMCLAGLLEYTWGTVSGSLQAAHHWSIGQTFWAFSFFVIFESFIQIFTGILRNRGILDVRWATIIGGIICGIVGHGL